MAPTATLPYRYIKSMQPFVCASCRSHFAKAYPRYRFSLQRYSASTSAATVEDDRPPVARQKEQPLQPLFPSAPRLPTTRWKPIPQATLRTIPSLYRELAKSNLSVLVVLTAMAGYAIAPAATTVGVLLSTAAGTALCSASANAFNQWVEVPYDAQMSRTRNRVLVRKAISPHHAFGFATVAGISGTGLLFFAVNPTTAALGALNIALYSGAYTALKRRSIINTWVGAVVGAIPPLMGWAACTGSIALFGADGSIMTGAAGGYLLAGILYSWQFPHFNPLAHNIRADYTKAGYRMMAATNPPLNRRVALRHAIALLPMCSIFAPALGITTWWFALDSAVMNAWLIRDSYQFWKADGKISNDKRARRLFFTSIIYLPVVLVLMMFHKQGADWMWYLRHGAVEDKDKKEPLAITE